MESKYSELYEKLGRLQWLLQRQHMQGHVERGPFADPTRGQGRVLAMLKLQPEISTKDLSYLLGIRQQSLNELLNKLEKGGYVTRTPSEADRRVMMVSLTEEGRRARQEEADHSDIFDCLNPEEQAAFGDYLDRVIAALQARVGADENDDMDAWMQAARSRMGNEQFDRLMAMRGGFGGMWGPHGRGHHGGRFGGRGPGPDGHGPGGHCPGRHGPGEHGPDGPAPEDAPSGEE